MSKEEIITKVNGFLVDEFEIDAALLNDNAALKKDLGIRCQGQVRGTRQAHHIGQPLRFH